MPVYVSPSGPNAMSNRRPRGQFDFHPAPSVLVGNVPQPHAAIELNNSLASPTNCPPGVKQRSVCIRLVLGVRDEIRHALDLAGCCGLRTLLDLQINPTGAKSSAVLVGQLGVDVGVEREHARRYSSKGEPSGWPRATAWAPTMLAAPARFSITTVCPRRAASFSPTPRASASVFLLCSGTTGPQSGFDG